MSLHQLANHMSAQGRGPDSTLVHMSPREVSGLQSLAMAHGGTLTINPQTGLPEAGFLDSLLPTLLGGAATFFSGGAINPAVIAAAVGGLTALTSKDLGKGLMAGLGAYGGSSIVSGLAGLGANAIGSEAATASGSFSDNAAADAASKTAQTNASYYDKLAAGASKAMSNPGDALGAMGGGNKFIGAAKLAMPVMAAFSAVDEPKTTIPEKSKTAFIRSYYKDPETGQQMANPAIPAEDWGTRNFGERIYAANGGLMALAGGGQTAYDYLDRKRSTSSDGEIVVDDTPPKPSLPPTGSDGKGSYIYNKELKKWVWTPDVKPVVPVNSGVQTLMDTGGPGGNDGQSSNPGWDALSDAQKAAFYDAHPNFQTVTQFGQKALGFLGLTNPKETAIASGTLGLSGYNNFGKESSIPSGGIVSPGVTANDYGKTSWGKTGDEAQDIGTTDPAAQAAAIADAREARDIENASAARDAQQAASQSVPDTASTSTSNTSNDTSSSSASASTSDTDCVDPSTLILLANGTQTPAGKLKVGDFLHTLHEDTFVYGDFEVMYVKTVQQPKNIVTFTDGHNLTASDSHKFLMSNRTWKRVDALEAGDTVETAKGINPDGFKTVAKIKAIGLGDVVKLTIDNAHTYVSEGLVSHNKDMAYGGYIGRYAQGGLGSLGGYSDGGRLLRGPGDGVSDSIPATVGGRQPARLADGEFVVPARIVSELGNGSTEAGARALYKMMDRIQANRRKTTGKNSVAVNSKSHKYLPA